jgi:nucleoside-diphosphate-sugar epimerase
LHGISYCYLLYCTAQVEAERVAWQLAEQYGLSLVTILPNFVLGPIFNPEMTGVSVSFMKVRGT